MVAPAIAAPAAYSAAGAGLDIENVDHAFDIDGAALPVLQDVSLFVEPGEFIAPQVGTAESAHNYFQDPEAFLALGGRRGKQLQVLTDGTFFINRWFATVELRPKTLIPIGFVGVVVSYYGSKGVDVTGAGFRYGEQVESGQRGVWRGALPPGKYALNPYALKVELVPTVNFVLRWLDDALRVETRDPVELSRWHHVAVTYDGSRFADGVKIYVDAVINHMAAGAGSGSGNGYAIDNLHFRASVNPIVQASAPLKLNGLNYAGGSGLSFSFTNVPGASFTVYSATNLTAPINWQPVGQPTEVLNGSYSTYQFTDPAGAAKSRFYRVTSP